MGPTGSLQTISAEKGFWYTALTTKVEEKHSGMVVVGDTVVTEWIAVDESTAETIDLIEYFNITDITVTADFPPFVIPGDMYSVSITCGTTNGGICLLR